MFASMTDMDRELLTALGRRIAKAREYASLTQLDLALACGYEHGSRIGNYEQGKREPSIADLVKIATTTGTRLAWLAAAAPPMIEMAVREGDPPIYDATGRRILALSQEELAQLDVLRSLSPDIRARLQSLGDALSKPPAPSKRSA